MNDNLPVNMEGQENGGTINYANEVIAIIAGMAMSEVDGVAGKRPAAKSVTERIGLTKAVNPVTKGVRVEVGSEEAAVDLTLAVEYGKPIQKVCTEVQENVRKAIETMTGLHVVKVDVHVTSVIFEKDEQATEAALIVGKTAEKAVESAQKQETAAQASEDPDAENDLDIDTEIVDNGEEEELEEEDAEAENVEGEPESASVDFGDEKEE